MKDLSDYSSLIFDCDGVVLNSNNVKTQAFRKVCTQYSQQATDELIKYHQENGGISRYVKFKYFLDQILPKYSLSKEIPAIEKLLEDYSQEAYSGLLNSSIAKGLKELRKKFTYQKWFIISGGDQSELRQLFEERRLSKFFNGGIFGSPDTKEEIIKREIQESNLTNPILFLGDSRADHLAAKAYGIDFIFLSSWTDFSQYNEYCMHNNIKMLSQLEDLMYLE